MQMEIQPIPIIKKWGIQNEIKNALEEKITELAVDSDLSVKESISL